MSIHKLWQYLTTFRWCGTNNAICSPEGSDYRSMEIIDALAQVKINRLAVELEITWTFGAPRVPRRYSATDDGSRSREGADRDQKRSWKSLPVIYIEPRIFGNRGKYPKVVSARTGLQSNWWRNGTVQGIEMQPGDTLMPRLQWHYNTVHSPLSGAYGFIGARLRFPVPINAKDSRWDSTVCHTWLARARHEQNRIKKALHRDFETSSDRACLRFCHCCI